MGNITLDALPIEAMGSCADPTLVTLTGRKWRYVTLSPMSRAQAKPGSRVSCSLAGAKKKIEDAKTILVQGILALWPGEGGAASLASEGREAGREAGFRLWR